MNKKGDIQSFLFVIVTLFGIGILIFFMSHILGTMYGEIDNIFQANEFNDTEAHQTIQEINSVEQGGVWDYAFLGIFIMYIMVLGFTAFSTRISPIFFWFYTILVMVGLFVATIVSNTWQAMASESTFAVTIARFPITNAILGTYYPTAVTVIAAIFMILLFGKPIGENQ